jgi:oxepin-CoA hydrolase/3-oxo-5,6-dehydrosuberyl-CoA semialdehyde dehydrogenase
MGPLATAHQQRDVLDGIGQLAGDGRLVFGDSGLQPVGVPEGKGYFVSPVLIEVEEGADAPAVHSREVFGPVATLVPYSGRAADAAELIARGGGGLVCSIYSEDAAFATEAALGVAPHNGRVFLGSAKIAELSPGPGTVLPQLVHGGPGRAGGGEELGGLRGLAFYTQRVAIEGSKPIVERLLKA